MQIDTFATEEERKRYSLAARACADRMAEAGLPELVIQNFVRLLHKVALGETGVIEEAEIEPVRQLASYAEVAASAQIRTSGERALPTLAVCKLNGGLGTSMGLRGAKSLLPVKGGMSFNDLNISQVRALVRRTNTRLWFLNMTSFSTHQDVVRAFDGVGDLQLKFFEQHKHPKVFAADLLPSAVEPDELNWNPPGHGDLYPALVTSGVLDEMLASGIEYLFVSNSDNSAASPDPVILGHLKERGVTFLMEVTRRTAADRKGGHLALRRRDNRLLLREAAQAPVGLNGEPCPEFQDIERYSFFNTNSLWINLPALKRLLNAEGGILPLPLIRNAKTLDPRDAGSPKVFQLETAMGAAIELFPGAEAIDVPRTRFMPVKTNTDLLLLRSDLFELSEIGTLQAKVVELPHLILDSDYRLIDAFEAKFQVVPSLARASRFEVRGNVAFNHPLAIVGDVVVCDERSDRGIPCSIPEDLRQLSNETLIVADNGFTIRPSADQ